MRIGSYPPLLRWITICVLLPLIAIFFWIFLNWRYRRQIVWSKMAPARWLGIVFGAGLYPNGKPSSILADRVTVAAKLYREGRISKLLLSGSTTSEQYDEPAAMRNLVRRLGVPEEDILLDRGGSRTFETCRRAKEIFQAEDVLLISQQFHLPRTLVICEILGINAVGVRADLRSYHPLSYRYWQLREIFATIVALWDAFRTKFQKTCHGLLH